MTARLRLGNRRVSDESCRSEWSAHSFSTFSPLGNLETTEGCWLNTLLLYSPRWLVLTPCVILLPWAAARRYAATDRRFRLTNAEVDFVEPVRPFAFAFDPARCKLC